MCGVRNLILGTRLWKIGVWKMKNMGNAELVWKMQIVKNAKCEQEKAKLYLNKTTHYHNTQNSRLTCA